MNFREGIRFSKSFLLSFALLWLAPAHAELKILQCAKYLVSMSADHSLPSMSASYTDVSLRSLHQFRTRKLGDFDYHPSNEVVNGGYYSRKNARQRVTSRMTAILEEGKSPTQIDGDTARKQMLFGSTVLGEDEILNALNGRDESLAQLKEENEEALFIENISNGFIHPFIAVINVGGVAMSSTLLSGHDIFPALLGTGFAFGSRWVYEVLIRSFQKYGGPAQIENETRKVLKNLREDKWYYTSFDVPMPIAVIREIWATRTLSEGAIRMYHQWLEDPKITRKLTSDIFMAAPSDEDSKIGWIRFDQLLSWDPQTNQPMLNSVLRLTEELPPYPKRAPVKSAAEETEAQGVLVPIVIPVNK